MKKKTSNRSGLLLMEIIIAILFFSVISAICLQLFVKSHTISRDTEELDTAVNQAASVADIIRGTEDAETALREYYPHMNTEDSNIYIYYDKEFKPCSEPEAGYYLEIEKGSSDSGITEYRLSVDKTGSASHIYELEIVIYKQLKP
ncbi:type IV pilus modification PilV family protein [Dorea sp. D27]|uniref:type IV pilus modification PilV family protein n=1 Tax=Dorea sp. D27 TaxID=658665 RepID=UPI000673285A|nr:hypothetical protein [Dorea sp. D27]KMZ54495.1 hypothetical protein HMPREF0980_01349 [Dorea sp. D27]